MSPEAKCKHRKSISCSFVGQLINGRGITMWKDITITNVTEMFTVFSISGETEKIQNRSTYGLSFCEEGQITYMHRGKEVISDPDHAVILPQGQSYNIYRNKTGIFPVINFTCAEYLCDTVIALPIHSPEVYVREFQQMQSLSLFEGNRAEILSIFYHMLQRLSMQSSLCRVIMPAIKYLESNYQNPALTNSELADQCNISEVYFRRVFLQHYHMTPKQYLIEIRINKAKQLLSEGALKINAVAQQCGFSNPYHFCHEFKERTGMTPTEYMRQNRIYKI